MYFITKKQSKQLRYIARANYKSEVKVTESANGKVKTRFFPVYGLSYDESKADKGMVELTKIKVLYKPFDGTYDELIAKKGYFQYLSPDGVRLTRDGRFKYDKDGNFLTRVLD